MELEKLYGQTRTRVFEMVALDKTLRGDIHQFIELRGRLDQLVGEELQPMIEQKLNGAITKTDRASSRAIGTMTGLIPVFILFSLGAGMLLVRGIILPLERLRMGTEIVTRGDLDYRIPIPGEGNNEFGNLTRHFNQMLAQLQQTTVPKDTMEKSLTQTRAFYEVNRALTSSLDPPAVWQALVESLGAVIPMRRPSDY